MSKLAVHGGDPIRRKPFPKWPKATTEVKDAIIGTLDNENKCSSDACYLYFLSDISTLHVAWLLATNSNDPN